MRLHSAQNIRRSLLEAPMVTINGKPIDAAGKLLAQWLETSGFRINRIVVEINGVIISPDLYASTTFKDGDHVEVVSFVGGG